jgi:hypothetical protein
MPRGRWFILSGAAVRWGLTGCAALLLAAWALSAQWVRGSFVGQFGEVMVRWGCLEVAYPVTPLLPPGLEVENFEVWPSADDYGFRVEREKDPWWRWTAGERRLRVGDSIDLFGGLIPGLETHSTGWVRMTVTGRVTTLGSASFRRRVVLPLWPAAFGSSFLAGLLWWRRWRFRQPWQCRGCGYDRRGLGPEAPCPECGALATPRSP